MERLYFLLALALEPFYPGIKAKNIEEIVRDKNDPMIIDIYLDFGYMYPRYDIRDLKDEVSDMYRLEFAEDDFRLRNIKLRYFAIDGKQVSRNEFYSRLPFLSDDEEEILSLGERLETEEGGFLCGVADYAEEILLGTQNLKLL